MTSVLLGDCRARMAELAPESVDAIVTDPPYGLSFMGKEWDRGVPGVPFWTEALRVLKPGGHLLAFGGTRTFHRLAVAIEDAGFEVRDCLSWLYGSGFPKSLDVSKAIDKVRDDWSDVREVCRFLRAAMDAKGLVSRDLAPAFGCDPRLIDHWAARDTDSQPALPKADQWARLKSLLSLSDDMDAEVARLNARKGEPGETWKDAEILGEHEGATPGFTGKRFTVRDRLIREATPAARAWAGFGTALKPAWEPIILARKPLVGTVAANVLRFGTGAVNVDGCRIGTTVETWPTSRSYAPGQIQPGGKVKTQATGAVPSGRWPANVVLDEEAAAALDEQTEGRLHSDSGGASRFFYTAKASRRERNAGLGEAANFHPTVKPVALMRWLVRLVTPPGGLVLDPFTGSGTTGVAATLEGFRFLGMEQSAEYAEIATRRIAHAAGHPAELEEIAAAAQTEAEAEPEHDEPEADELDGLPLFAEANR